MRNCFLILATLVGMRFSGYAQTLYDARGREFWVAFEQNEGLSTTPSKSFRLYLISPHSSWVTVHAMNGSFDSTLRLVPNIMQEIVLSDSLELKGSELVSNQVVHVTATNNIACSGLNTFSHSSDAFLCVPQQMCDTGYTVLSYPANYTPGAATPSQFAVIGEMDNTTVTITPSANTVRHRAGQTFTIALQRGQVYQVQSELPSSFSADIDLTGTTVTANHPIGVLSGQLRANVPFNSSSTRDFICEYLLPSAACDTAYIIPPIGIKPQVATVYRVMAIRKNTRVVINGGAPVTLAAGQFVERLLTTVQRVVASVPVVAAVYEQSDGGNAQNNDDPFMLICPSTPRFRRSYGFSVPTAQNFVVHYANLVVPTKAVPSLRLDGAAAGAAFMAVAGTSYSWATMFIAAGGHTMTCDSAFGLTVYGAGTYDTYGMMGGTGMERFEGDRTAPIVNAQQVTCDSVAAWIVEDSLLNMGIASITTIDSLTNNVAVNVPPFVPGVDSVFISVVQKGSPAEIVLLVKDLAGNSRVLSIAFPKVRSLHVDGALSDTYVFLDPECDTLIVRNVGTLMQRVTGFSLAGTQSFSIKVLDSLPKNLEPLVDSIRIVACYDATATPDSGFISVTTASCGTEEMLVLNGSLGDLCKPILLRGQPAVLNVTPNPATAGEDVALHLEGEPNPRQIIRFSLSDVFGRVVYSSTALGTNQVWLNTSLIDSGVYVCFARSEYSLWIGRIIVAH